MADRIVRRVHSELRETSPAYVFEGDDCRHARGVAEFLAPIIGNQAQEVFAALLLDGKQRVLAYHEVTRGTLTASLVHPREVFGAAVRHNAAALIVAHNHPSGDPEPSAEDLAVTERLRQAGELLGIPLQDHVIIGASGTFTSLRLRLAWGRS